MSVVLAVEEVGPCRKQLKVEVPAPAVEAETNRLLQDYQRQVALPGFRKGKAPVSLVKKRFQADIDKEVVERLLPRFWRIAEAEAGIDPLLEPELGEVNHKPGEPLVFTASVDVRPDVDLGSLEGWDLPVMPPSPSEDEIASALQDLQRRVAPFKTVERAAAVGDLVALEVTQRKLAGDAEGEDEAESEPEGADVEVGGEGVWEELTLAVTGLSAGQKGEFRKVHPAAVPDATEATAATAEGAEEGSGDAESEDGQAEATEATEATEAADETREYRFVVSEVKEREIPELDDDLAKKLGGFETVEDLRQDLGMRIASERNAEARRNRETSLLDQLRERNALELPERVVAVEQQELLNEYAESLRRRGVEIGQAEIDWQGIFENMKTLAERRVHARLLLDAAAEKLEVEVPEDEFERALSDIAKAQNVATPELRQALDGDGRLAKLRAQLRRDKTLRQLLGEGPADLESGAGLPSDDD